MKTYIVVNNKMSLELLVCRPVTMACGVENLPLDGDVILCAIKCPLSLSQLQVYDISFRETSIAFLERILSTLDLKANLMTRGPLIR